jgi:glucosyl-dolichyl phosphate glucuronosyltransferase
MRNESMPATTSDVSVIICAYTDRRWDDLQAAVSSVQCQSVVAHEVLVVIDHNPGLYQKASAAFDGVIVIENTQPQGLSGARNTGIAHATGTYIAFLDDDAVAEPLWLASLLATFKDEMVMGAGGTVAPAWVDRQPRWFPPEFYWVVGCSYQGMPETTTSIRNPIGANMIFRREIFAVAGDFRTEIGRIGTLPIGCEETELCIRARQQWPQRYILFVPAAMVRHRIPPGRATWRYFASRCYAEGISKATISRFVGAKDSLSSERSYTTRTLPAGVLREIRAAFVQRSWAHLLSAGTIIAGLMITAIGYGAGMLQSMRSHGCAPTTASVIQPRTL